MSRNIIVRIKRCKQVILLLLCTGILAFSGCTPASENLQPLQNYKTLIDFQYDLVDIKQDEKVIVVKQDGLYGAYVKANGSWELKIPIQYTRIFCQQSIAAYLDEDHVDLYRLDGSRIIEQTVRGVGIASIFNESGITVSIDGEHVGYMSLAGEWILEPKYTPTILPITDDSYLVNTESETSSDWIDVNGESLLPKDKNIIGVLDDSTFPCINVLVNDNGTTYYGVIDPDGNYILPPIYSNIIFKRDEAGTLYLNPYDKLSQTAYLYRPNGEKVFQQGYTIINPASEGLFEVKENDRFGVVNEKGDTVIPIINDSITAKGQFIVTGDNNVETTQRFSYRIYDKAGNPISKTEYDEVYLFEDAPNLAVVEKDQKIGFLSADSKISIPLIYEDFSRSYSEDCDVLLVKKDGKWGGIDLENNVLIDFLYSDAVYCSNDLIYAVRDRTAGVISADGNIVLPFELDPPVEPHPLIGSEHIVVAWKNGKCGCVEIER